MSSGAISPPAYSAEEYEIRHAKDNKEINLVWSRFMLELGWDRFGDDLATYMSYSKAPGMLLAFKRGSEQPIGHIAAVVNENSTGWVAMFIVDAPYRGVKLGAALWDAMIQDFRDCKTKIVGLDAVPQQKATYERRGFVDSKLGRLEFMSRSLGPLTPAPSPAEHHLLPIRDASPQLLAEFEDKYDGFLRPGLWKNLLSRPDVVGFIHAKKSSPTSVNDILSCGLVRRSPNGVRVGPLIAQNELLAQAVLSKLIEGATPEYVLSHKLEGTELSSLPAEEVASRAVIVAEAWTGNKHSLHFFERAGFASLGHFHRMWLDDKATPPHREGGLAQEGLFAAFDAAVG